jgi:hypothetical protein
VRAASSLDVEVAAAWASPEVHARIRAYLNETVKKSS